MNRTEPKKDPKGKKKTQKPDLKKRGEKAAERIHACAAGLQWNTREIFSAGNATERCTSPRPDRGHPRSRLPESNRRASETLQDGLRPRSQRELHASVVSPTFLCISSVIPAKAGIQNALKILDSGSRFACPE
jgi:hypothetical protein